jgi:hypothetical protein
LNCLLYLYRNLNTNNMKIKSFSEFTQESIYKNPNDSGRNVLGSINPPSARLDEMARVGYIGGKFEVYVWTDDPGNIPHFHIRDTNSNGNEFETCVRLDKPEYFLHGHYRDKLNSSQKKALNEFMRDTPKTNKYDTNYELAVDMWNLNNSSTSIAPEQDNGNIVIPDYTKLE